jgi:hypothetical protein
MNDVKGFYEVNIIKTGEHVHKIVNTQLRGNLLSFFKKCDTNVFEF